MNAYISKIFILNKDSEIRGVAPKPGLNIITGNSKTGKSALIEIVDYCLCSKISSIPKGVISDFGHIFGIIICFPTKYLIIGRKNYNEGGYSRVYVTTSTKEPSKIDLAFFNNLKPYLRKDGQSEIEKHLGLSVSNMSTSDDVDIKEKRKASLR